MNEKQHEKIKSGHGFIAALDQSGGSTPEGARSSTASRAGCLLGRRARCST